MEEHEMSFYIVFCKGKQATTKQPDLDPIAIPVKKQGASIARSSSIEKKHMMKGGPCTRGLNNNISLEAITFNNNNNNNNNYNNYLHLGTHRSHQCQGFHACLPTCTPFSTFWEG